MTTTKLVGILAALAIGSSAFAQTSSDAPAYQASGTGLLGHRYIDYGAAYTDINHSSVDVWTVGATLNNPIAPNVDVSVDLSHSWLKGWSTYHATSLGANATYYYDTGAFKPFGGAGVGYSWVNHSDNTKDWHVFGGVEYIVNPQIVLTGTVDYSSDFKRGNNGDEFSGSVRGNYWFTKTVSAFAGVIWHEGGPVGYGAGVTLKF